MTNKDARLFKEVLVCINDHLNDTQFSVETICTQVGLSERQLQRKLKGMTGKTPNQIIRSVRLERAKMMLLEQPDNIADIAVQTGFFSPSYFSKCFKQKFGVSPSQFVQQQDYPSEML
ncbi:MAG: AraC family transcriptional regulator [Bacteroidota bacterium]